jgi:peptidoglycan hydrolase CwlO-like protein
MQQSIDKLKADIQTIQTTRNELQAKLDQSDKDVAAQMKKIEEINTKIAEKQKAADAQAAEKKQ